MTPKWRNARTAVWIVAAIMAQAGLARADTVTVVGIGTAPCEFWTRVRNSISSDPAAFPAKSGQEDWVVGYLSGKAVASGKDRLENADVLAMFSAISERCKLKPTERIFDAANYVWDKLK
ncbi:MAG: hypothetical protein WCI94_08740 [Rhodospirillales bacterium]